MAKDNTITQILICQCHSYDHMIHIFYDKDEQDPSMSDVAISVHLRPLRWYERIWHAIKYVFGFRSRYGDFDEFLFKPEDYKALKDAAKYLEDIYNNQNK